MAHSIEIFNETKSRKAWSEDPRCKIGLMGLRKRLDAGWDPEEAITTPPKTVGSPVGSKGGLHTAFNEIKSVNAWAQDKRCNVSRTQLRKNLAAGLPVEAAMQKVRKPKPKRDKIEYKKYEAFGESKTINGWIQDPRCNVTFSTLRRRFLSGMDTEKAITTSSYDLQGTKVSAFGESKHLKDWSFDERCVVDVTTLRSRFIQGMPLEQAITALPNSLPVDYPSVKYEAFGESKSLGEWLVDERCNTNSTATLHSRIHRMKLSVEEAITTETRAITSSQENVIAEYIESLDIDIERNTRKIIPPLELDIYIPSKNLAVEYNGIYWHSEPHKTKWDHYKKWEACEQEGIQLIQIWEDDYLRKPEVINSLLRHKLGKSSDKVYARKCTVRSTIVTPNEFYINHHIQGGANASVTVELYDNDLVAACSFISEPDGVWNLVRYATSKNVVGGFTRCLKHFQRKYDWKTIRTFADLCVSDGRLYELAGFENCGKIPPDYRYVYEGFRQHKFGFRLKRFRNDPNLMFMEGLTESELAVLNDIPRIWDAGKIRYVLRND